MCAQYEDEVILCVANLSRSAQAVEIDLSAWSGRVPIEMLGRTRFPPIGDLPYLLTLAALRLLLVLAGCRGTQAGRSTRRDRCRNS